MGITPSNRDSCLEILQKMVFAKSEEEYNKLYDDLNLLASKSVLDYFNSQWHPIRDEWTLGVKLNFGTFMNTTNNSALIQN